MLTKVRYSPKDILLWTRWETAFLLLYLGGVTALYELLDLRFLHVPWAPVAVLGTAVAFIVGFQNNAAYGRIWEARKIWGGIVNVSRTWGMQTLDMVDGRNAESPVSEEELREHRQILIHRHVAWLTALRHAMRLRPDGTAAPHRRVGLWLGDDSAAVLTYQGREILDGVIRWVVTP